MAAGLLLVGAGFAVNALARALLPLTGGVLIWTLGEMLVFPIANGYWAEYAAARGPRPLRRRLQRGLGSRQQPRAWSGRGCVCAQPNRPVAVVRRARHGRRNPAPTERTKEPHRPDQNLQRPQD